MADANFPNGLIVKVPHQNAPAFVKCTLSFKVQDFINTLQQNNINGWMNVDVKMSRNNSLYADIDSWQPTQQQAPPQQGYQQAPQQNQYQQQPPQQQNNYQQPPQGNQPPPQGYQAPPQQPQPQYDPNAGFDPNSDVPF
jgi:hypothetical protein